MRQPPRLKPCRVRGKPMWKVDDRDAAGGGGRYFFPRTDEGKGQAKEKIEELIRLAILADDQPAINPLVDREAVLRDYGAEWLQHRGGRIRTRRSREDLFTLHVVPFDLGGGHLLGDMRVRDL